MSIKVNVNSAPGSARVSTGTSPVSIKVVQQGPQGATGATGPQGPAGASSATGTYSLPGIYWDIRDFAIGNESTNGNDWGPALQACVDSIGADGELKTVLIPAIDDIGAFYIGGDSPTIPVPTAGTEWTFLFACRRWYDQTTWDLPAGTKMQGIWAGAINATTGQFRNGCLFNGPADPKIKIGSGSGNCHIENFTLEGGGLCIHIEDAGTSTINNIKATGNGATKPALLIDSSFWVNVRDCLFQNSAFPSVHITSTTALNVGPGIIDFNNLQLSAFGVLIDPQTGTQAGGINITDCLMESGQTTDAMIVTDSSGGIPIHDCNFQRIGAADNVGDFYIYKNVGSKTGGIRFVECAGLSVHPDSDPVQGFEVQLGAAGTGGVNVGQSFIAPATNPTYGIEWPEAVDKILLAAPRAPQIVVGQAQVISQDYSAWDALVEQGGAITACRAPDGSLTAGAFAGGANDQTKLYDTTYAQADAIDAWFIAGCWVQNPSADETTTFAQTFFSKGPLALAISGNTDLTTTTQFFTDVGVGHSLATDKAWHWFCTAVKVLTNTGNVRVRYYLQADDETLNFFNPSLMYIPPTDSWTDKAIVDVARQYRGGWSPTAVQSEMGILDHQTFYSGTALSLIDGVTAPGTVSGRAQIYVDAADGDLKVKFGDGTVKTIVVDT